MAHDHSSSYRITDPANDSPAPRQDPQPAAEKTGSPTAGSTSRRRALLWVLLTAGLVVNVATTFSGLHPAVSAAAGAATLLCLVLLALDYTRTRRR